MATKPCSHTAIALSVSLIGKDYVFLNSRLRASVSPPNEGVPLIPLTCLAASRPSQGWQASVHLKSGRTSTVAR